MRNFISSREIFIDKAFFKCTVKLLEWRNAQKKEHFSFEELVPYGGVRTESVLIELEGRKLCRREHGKIWIAEKAINRDYLDGARSFLREWEKEGRDLNIKVGIGILGFILALANFFNDIFDWY